MTFDQPFFQILLLLGCAVVIVLAFQRLHVPSSLGYLLVGLVLGPHTAGPVVDSLAGDGLHATVEDDPAIDRLHPLKVPEECRFVGRPLSALPLDGVALTALVRSGQRILQPSVDTAVAAGDTLVLFGPADALALAEAKILR